MSITESALKQATDILARRDKLIDDLDKFRSELGVNYVGTTKAALVVQRTDRTSHERRLEVVLTIDAFHELTAAYGVEIAELNRKLQRLGVLTVDQEFPMETPKVDDELVADITRRAKEEMAKEDQS